MYVEPFQRFVFILRGMRRVPDTVQCTAQEHVAIFLHNIAFNLKNRSLKFYFKRLGETIRCYFSKVLSAIIDMEDTFSRSPDPKTPLEIQNRHDWWSYFQVFLDFTNYLKYLHIFLITLSFISELCRCN